MHARHKYVAEYELEPLLSLHRPLDVESRVRKMVAEESFYSCLYIIRTAVVHITQTQLSMTIYAYVVVDVAVYAHIT